ncbi:MAG: hypothetical protein LQ340_005682 [Diploschistes diacapsis]|nr:MAG: hypothetical protein LQ340_005682 [Diploschistes diacapsis]
MGKKIIDVTLQTAKELGIQNILALRGDPPREDEYRIDSQDFEGSEDFKSAADLVRYIRKEYGDYFCIGVAGYPEGHSDESHPAQQDPQDDMPFLLEKVQAGADFTMTQLFFDELAFLSYERLVREWKGGAMKDLLIIPGLMPIQSFAVLKRTTDLSHAKVPKDILEKLMAVRSDDESVKQVGVNVLSSIVSKIKSTPSPHQRGFHFFTLNLEKVVSLVLEKCNLIPQYDEDIGRSAAIEDSEYASLTKGTHNISLRPTSRRPSSPHNHTTTPLRTSSSSSPPSRATDIAIMHGIGSLGREATWDDYPNGRFGDARSPAFGEIDGYGPSLHLSPSDARAKWGYPISRSDLSKLFLRHLRGELDQLPWSEGPLNAETRVIEKQLCRLIEKRGWWSIASQPAADGVMSSDQVFGWGPKGGFVFQKAFVEFWIPEKDWREVLKPCLTKPGVKEKVSWYAAANPEVKTGSSSFLGANGSLEVMQNGIAHSVPQTAFESSSPASSVDSVTWGSFPGKEIVTPTIIEEMSFRAWVEEAFGIWREWERCYAVDSESRKIIRSCREQCWLVNVIGHVYQEPEALWKILMEA